MAKHKLKRIPTHEEIILEYKGLLKGKKNSAEKSLNIFRKHYDHLQKK